MHLIGLFLIASVIVITSIFFSIHHTPSSPKEEPKKVISVSPTSSSTSNSGSQSSPTPLWTPLPTVFQPTQLPSSLSTQLIYPNATNIQKNSSVTTFQTSDSPDIVTNWYKNLITSLHMNTQTFIKTNTNNNVSNKLVGANATNKIEVDITKQSNDTLTSVSLVSE